MLIIPTLSGFDWDEANKNKNVLKHQVTNFECEEIFFHDPLLIHPDIKHSKAETRYHALGQTAHGRTLFISFTIRQNLIRIISARDMSKKERHLYEKA